MTHTRHSYSENLGDHGIFLYIPGDSSHADDSLHENERGDSRGDGSRRGSKSQEIINYYFHNYRESVDGDGRSGYRSLIRPSLSYHPGDLVISLDFYSYSHDRSRHRYKTSQFYSYNHGGI